MRRHYLDNIRWITVLLVVFYHVIFIYNSVVPNVGIAPFYATQYWDGVLYLLYPWFMVLLFIVAGMSARYYLETHSVKDFVRSRSGKLLVPSTLGVLLFGWVQGYVSMTISNAFESIPDTVPAPVLYFIMALSGTGVLWFAQLLWLFSMLLALLRRFETGRLYALTEKATVPVLLLLVILVWCAAQLLNMPVITVYRFGIYGVTFFLGYFVFAHDTVIDRLSKWRYTLIVAAAVLGAFYLYLHFGDNYADMPVVGSVSAVTFAWIAILAIFGGMRAWCDRTFPFAAFMQKRSFGIYVFHYLPLSATAYLLRRDTTLGALPCYLLVGCAALLGSLLLYELISRIPFLRWCILGMKKSKSGSHPST